MAGVPVVTPAAGGLNHPRPFSFGVDVPPPEFHKYLKKVVEAAKRVDTEATHAQREAGNARVGKIYFHGLQCSIEFPKGSLRKGIGADGKEWSRPMSAHYGRINRTMSPHDGDPVDFYLGEHPESQIVFVISQLTDRGDLDEHKCVLGTRNVAEAKKLYLDHYPSWWKEERLGEVRGYTMEQFKKWLASNNPVKHRRVSKSADLLPGGEGDDRPDSAFPAAALVRGATHETEHTSDRAIAKEIAKDHLTEDEDYYKKLEKIEKAAGCRLDRYRCPHCGDCNAYDGNHRTGHKFNNVARCTDCGKFFSIADAKPTEKASASPLVVGA